MQDIGLVFLESLLPIKVMYVDQDPVPLIAEHYATQE